jgi:hypothetical protein
MSYKTGQYVIFKCDCELNQEEDWIKAGTSVEIANHWKQVDGMTPVIITKGYSFNGNPKQFTPYVEFFMNEAFE